MVTGKNFVLGFLTRDPSAEGTTRMMVGAQEEAEKNGYLIKLLPIPKDADYRVCIERSIEQRLAGMLVQNIGPQMFEYLHAETARFHIPVALIDDPPPQDWGTRVISDDEGGLKIALEHLLELGHRHIGFVAAQANSPLSVVRAQLFRDLMRENGLPRSEHSVIWTDWQEPEVTVSRVREFLASEQPRPTALMCAGDMIAMSALRAARSLGISLPDELSIIGFADLRMAAFADPPLTTIAQPFEEIGRAAVRSLLGKTTTDEAPGVVGREPITVPTRLIVRSSTAPPAR